MDDKVDDKQVTTIFRVVEELRVKAKKETKI